MIKVFELIEQLKQYPEDAAVYAYEGEDTGIAIVEISETDKNVWKQLGFIPASCDD